MIKRRIVVFLLVMMMVVAMVPLTALAEVTLDETIASMSIDRGYYPAAALLQDGRVLVVGGDQSSSSATNSAEIYNPATNTWSTAASCLTTTYRRGASSAVTLDDGRVLIAGGDVYGDGFWGLFTTQIFDPAGDDGVPGTEGAWSYGPDMTYDRCYPTMAKLQDGRVLVIGGRSAASSLGRAECEIYDPSTNTWTTVASLNQGRGAAAATTLNDGRVLVTGGDDDDYAAGRLASCEIYDPDANTWTTVSDFPLEPGNTTGGKAAMALVTLPDGRAFMIGGNSGESGSTGADKETYYYYPDTDTWVDGPVLSSAFEKSRGGYTQFADGTVFFAGGGNDSDDYVDTVFTIYVDEPTLEPSTGLTISPGTLSPGYHEDTRNYIAMNSGDDTFPNSQSTMDFTPTSSEPKLRDITVDGVVTASGATATVNLDPGMNDIQIVVTDTDSISRLYTVKVTREGNAPSTKTVLEDCAPTKLLGVNGLDISSPSTTTSGVGTLTVTTADADNNFDDILYTPAEDYSGTFTVNYTTDTGAKTINVTVTEVHDVRFEDSDHSEIETRYILDGSTVSSDGGTVSDPGAPAHYSFDNWDSAQAGNDYSSAAASLYVPVGDTTFTADYAIDQHTITTTENGGNVVSSLTRDYNGTINEGDVGTTTQTGYDFDAWYEDDVTFNTAVTFPYTVVADDTWFAKWTATDYAIDYNLDDGTNGSNPTEYTIETETITFVDATKDEYTFGGWFTDADCTAENEITQIAQGSTGDVEVWAKWTAINYMIAYQLDGGANHANNPTSYTIESSLIILGEPSREGYLFDGWYTTAAFAEGTEITEIPAGSTGDVEVWVNWTQETSESEGYGIVRGNISDDNGLGKEGVAVTLNSSPRTTFTDENGDFQFDNVEFVDHRLVLTNSEGVQIGEYELNFTQGSQTSIVINGTVADIIYEDNAVVVQIDITMNASGDGTNLDDITLISNPQTSDQSNGGWMIWAGAAIVLIVLAAAVLILIARRRAVYAEE